LKSDKAITSMPELHAPRRKQLRKALRKNKVDALLITAEKNVKYLTGFTGDSTWLLMTPDDEVLFSDFRYTIQLAEECADVPALIRTSNVSLVDAVTEQIRDKKIERIGVEGHVLTMNLHQTIQDALEGIDMASVSWEVEKLRTIKDKYEIAETRNAVELAERGFQYLQALLTPEATELQLSFELEHAIRNFGGAGVAFHPIIAVGDRAALCHYRPGPIKLADSPILLCDWGAETHSGYKSDLTRTMITGKIPAKFEKIYKTVLESQELAIAAIKPGASCQSIDQIARDFIKKAGFGKYFDHGLGHGIGLDIHELPRFSQSSDEPLKAGMVVTVEPGIYLPGWGGVRIEDDVLVTKSGCEVLSSVPKDWDSVTVRC